MAFDLGFVRKNLLFIGIAAVIVIAVLAVGVYFSESEGGDYEEKRTTLSCLAKRHCSDDTGVKDCSKTRPFYCNSECKLVVRTDQCPCLSGMILSPDGKSCVTAPTPTPAPLREKKLVITVLRGSVPVSGASVRASSPSGSCPAAWATSKVTNATGQAVFVNYTTAWDTFTCTVTASDASGSATQPAVFGSVIEPTYATINLPAIATVTPTPTPMPTASPTPTPAPTVTPTPTPTPVAVQKYVFNSLGYLDRSPLDSVNDFGMSQIGILDANGQSSGFEVASSNTPLVFKGVTKDLTAVRQYTVEERDYFYTQSNYYQADKQVEAQNTQLAYSETFTNPIQVCTEFTPDDSTCEDTYKTALHGVVVKFLGKNYKISAMENFNANVALPSGTNGARVTLVSVENPSETVTLTNGMVLDMNNQDWNVRLIGGGPTYGASLAQIQVVRQVVSNFLKKGESVSLVNQPARLRFVFNGLEDVAKDTLAFNGVGGQTLITGNGSSVSGNFVRITSGKSNAFQFAGTSDSANSVYLLVGNPVTTGSAPIGGAAVVGVFIYQIPGSGFYRTYYNPAAKFVAGTNTLTQNSLSYQYGTKVQDIVVDPTAINAADPDNLYALAVKEYLTTTDSGTPGAWLIDIGRTGAGQTPVFLASGAVARIGYNATFAGYDTIGFTGSAWESGYISPRGSTGTISASSATINYATTLARAAYTLEGGAASPIP